MASEKGVVFVTSINLARHSAAVVNIMQMCNAFAKAGAKVILVIPEIDVPAEELFAYYRVEHPFQLCGIFLPKALMDGVLPGRAAAFAILSAGRILRLARKYPVYSRDPWVFTISALLSSNCSMLEIHQFRFHSRLQTLVYRALIRFGMKMANARMICISSSLMRQWREHGVAAEKMLVAHDAANPAHYRGEVGKARARRELGLPEEGALVAYTGSLMPSKGVDVLVRCANRLPSVDFVVVGGDETEIEELRRLCTGNNVVFTGHRPPRAIPLYQAAADILALPNTRGSAIDDVTSPMKLFEYMAAERPIVASDMPTLVEILEHDRNALISPAGDDAALSRNVERILTDPHLGARLAQNAKKDLANYTWDKRVSTIASLFPASPESSS